MKFTLEIKCDNAAFEDFPATEISRILVSAADGVKNGDGIGPFREPLFDINGNRVGQFVLTEGSDE